MEAMSEFKREFISTANKLAKADPENKEINEPVERLNDAIRKKEEASEERTRGPQFERRSEPDDNKPIVPKAPLVEEQDKQDKQEKRKELAAPEIKEPPSVRESIQEAISGETKEAPTRIKEDHGLTEQDKQRSGYNFLPDTLKSNYQHIDPEIRNYIDKLADDNAQIETKRATKKYLDEVDEVLKPYRPALDERGITEGQLVRRLVNYFSLLSNEQTRIGAFAHIAKSYGIDLSLLNQPEFQETMISDFHRQYQEYQQRQHLEAAQAQRSEVGNRLYSEWKNERERPHLDDAIYADMNRLLTTLPQFYYDPASFPNTNGVNLDKLYEDVCAYRGKEPYTRMQAKNVRSIVRNPKQPNPGNTRHKNSSVRESLRAAIAEHRA